MNTCVLLLEGTIVSTSHCGYCSGNECDDLVLTEQHAVTLHYSSYDTLDHLKYLQSIDALDELFNKVIQFSYKMFHIGEENYYDEFRGLSGYCRPSPSGRHHETDFTATKVIKVIDINDDAIGENVHVNPVWFYAHINEFALADFINLLQSSQ
jgi:hypothetical protein